MQEEISFGQWLRKQRRGLDLSRQAFAGQVGCAEVTLRRIEVGTLKPSKELAAIILEKLGIPEIDRSQWISFARGSTAFPLSSGPSKKPITNLPAPITTFIGREKEQSDVIRLLAKHRLITFTGPGGVGKTRLSTKVGEHVLENYPDGVWLVELAPILDPMLVPHTTAVALGLHDAPEQSVMEMLSIYLRVKKILLILDNCEHLLDACAQFADTLLKRCSQLKMLATSREALGILGESVYSLPSLELPDIQQLVEKFRDYESVRLFEERAQLARTDFSMTIENALFVAGICRRLDGIPLAIELAAAQVGTFSTEQVAARLEESFSLLATGNRAALPRHQTLRAAIDWSYDLLSQAEKTLFRRLSVFMNGWTPETAEAVCTDANTQPETILNLLIQLVNKSLVMPDEQQVGTRYHMLEIIRQYAHEQLLESGEEIPIRRQHLNYFLKLSEQIERELAGPQQMEWFARADNERNNLRAALDHACRTNVEAGLYIAARLGLFWTHRDLHEGRRWLTELLLNPESKAHPHARAKALCTQSELLYDFQQYEEAQAAAEESLALFRGVGDPYGEVDGLFSLGVMNMLGSSPNPAKGSELAHQALALAQSLGDIRRQADALDLLAWDHREFKRAFSYWEEAIMLYRQIGHWSRLARSLSSLGFFLLMDGQLDTAQKYLNESKLFFEQLNLRAAGHLRNSLGQIAILRGDFDQARTCFLQEAEISSELGSTMYYLWAKVRLGYLELLTGNFAEARQIFAETVKSFQMNGSQGGVAFALEGISGLYVALDRPDVAARLIGFTDTTREKISDTRPKLEQAEVDKIIKACLVKMGVIAYTNAYDEGRVLTLDEAVLYALDS